MVGRLLGRRIHISWIVAWASAGTVIGLVLVPFVPATLFLSIAWLLCSIPLIVGGMLWPRVYFVCLAVAGGVLLGLWRGTTTFEEASLLRSFVGQEVTLQGVVSEDVDVNGRGQSVLRLGSIVINGRHSEGKVWVTTTQNASIQRSDTVTVQSMLRGGFGNFTGTMQRARVIKVERTEPGDVALAVRNKFSEGVKAALDEPQSSLGLGYLVGMRRGLPLN